MAVAALLSTFPSAALEQEEQARRRQLIGRLVECERF